MLSIALSWEDWRRVIAVLRGKGRPYMLDHANVIEERLEMHAPNEPAVTLTLNDVVYHRDHDGIACEHLR
jgi:hypothetical protein